MNENMKSIQTIERKFMILEQLLCDVHDQVVEKKVCPVCEQNTNGIKETLKGELYYA